MQTHKKGPFHCIDVKQILVYVAASSLLSPSFVPFITGAVFFFKIHHGDAMTPVPLLSHSLPSSLSVCHPLSLLPRSLPYSALPLSHSITHLYDCVRVCRTAGSPDVSVNGCYSKGKEGE